MDVSFQVLPPAKIAVPLKSIRAGRVWWKRLGVSLAIAWHLPTIALSANIDLTLAWNPSPSPGIAGYNVYSGGQSGIYTNEIAVGNTTSVTLSNLNAGYTYYFVVTCYDDTGVESPPSNEAVYTVPADPAQPPGALDNPSMSAGGFSFSVPGGTGTNFVVEASVDLINWIRVQTNTAPFTFVDTNANAFDKRFYRTVALP